MVIFKLFIKYFPFTIFPYIATLIYKFLLEIEFQLLQDFLLEVYGILMIILLVMCTSWKIHLEKKYSEFAEKRVEKPLFEFLRKFPKPILLLLRIIAIITFSLPLLYWIWQTYVQENTDEDVYIFLEFARSTLGISNDFFAMYVAGILMCCSGIVLYGMMEKFNPNWMDE
jgi:hypothetical protein